MKENGDQTRMIQVVQQIRLMGQILANDQLPCMGTGPSKCNSVPITSLRELKVCPGIQVPFHQILYQQHSHSHHECVFKFLPKTYVSVLLAHRTDEYEQDGIPFASASENVYGYKHKNSQKVKKETLFKMRIVGDRPHIISLFAELKLLSILELGPYIGRMADNSDGYLTSKFIEFFAEVTPDFGDSEGQKFREKLEAVVERIKQKSLVVDGDRISALAFSPFQKVIIAKVYTNPNPKPQKHIHNNSTSFNNDSENCSVKSSIIRNIRKEFDEESRKVMKTLDLKTKMLSCLQNLLFQHNVEKAVQLFEQAACNIDSRKQKLMYVDQFCNLVAESVYFKEYEEQVISEALATSCILPGINSTLMGAGESYYSKKLEDRLNKLRMGSTEFGSEKELEDYSHPNSMDLSSFRLEQLKINIQGNNKIRIKEIIKDIKEKEMGKSIENDYEVSYEYALMLMKSRRSRHALALFETLAKDPTAPENFKTRILNLMGIIYYNRDQFSTSRRQFETGLTRLLKIRLYSPAMALFYNNIGVTLFRQKMLDPSLEYFNRCLTLATSSVDYRMMARCNRAVAFMEKNLLNEARNEFLQIFRMYEPVNNASILCKTYSNLGYLDLLQKNEVQAMANLEAASRIESTCLIPNGYKPSIYLHNNLAMLYFRKQKKNKRKSLAHIEKCKGQMETLRGLEAVTINFNFAMVYKELFIHEFTLWHLSQARRLLLRMEEGLRIQYLGKIEAEIEKINGMRIVEDSEESSYYNRQSFTSRYSSHMN